jgi:type VI secretion system protein ImpJ
MKAAQKVVWTEGLLMAPQHLQQQDLFHQSLLCDRLDALDPFNWGLTRVELDKKALSANQVKLAALRGVLPDGTVLVLDENHPEAPASRVIAEHFPHTQLSLDVYLALPAEREGVDNFAPSSAAPVRYAQAKREVHDLAGSGTTAEVVFARRKPLLVFGDESRDGLVCMKIVEIVRDDAGGLVVAEPFIPACLRVDASAFLMAGLRRLLATMVTRHKSLSEARSEAGKSSVEFSAKDVTRFLLLSTINSHIPVLTHVVDSGHVSPHQCYLMLSQLAGQLTTFSTEIRPTDLPSFVYTDLRSTFETLLARLTALLQSTIEEHYVSVPLEGRANGMHVGNLQTERLWACDRFLLAIKTDLPEQPTATQVPRLAKIASLAEIQGILSAATPGAPVEVTYRPPPEIPVKAGLVYFTVATDNAYFRNIKIDKNIAVYLPPLFDPAKTTIQLMGVPARAR